MRYRGTCITYMRLLRFKKVTDAEGERYVAWYKPDHKAIRLAAPFFAARFAGMRWSISDAGRFGSIGMARRRCVFRKGIDSPPNGE